ncbi:hypothetical protein MKX08_002919 [Trichoderma sp. CBMAI-0020]|nr:hypothetical protein MKX08_002919 [Trichoderma sp. CBMAI-0020]
MPLYHVVLFKLKPEVTAEQIENWGKLANAMLGQVPGLTKISFGKPLPATASRAKGFDMGLVAILDSPAALSTYATHDAHLPVMKLREELCDDAMAYDLEFDV